jgi:hypothetical protein
MSWVYKNPQHSKALPRKRVAISGETTHPPRLPWQTDLKHLIRHKPSVDLSHSLQPNEHPQMVDFQSTKPAIFKNSYQGRQGQSSRHPSF